MSTLNNDTQLDVNISQNAAKLHTMINHLKYKPNWSFFIFAHAGIYKGLKIRLNTVDSTRPSGSGYSNLLVDHQFQIPYYAMTTEQLERWLLDCILLVELHEACEQFKLNDEAIFFPEHGENSNPYKITRK